MQCVILYKECGRFPDTTTGELIQYAKIQIFDPTSRVSEKGRVGSPAYFLKGNYDVIASIPDEKIGGKFEIKTTRIPKKDTIEERVISCLPI